MAKKKKRTNKEKELKRKLEALKANQKTYINNEVKQSSKVEKVKKNDKKNQPVTMNVDKVLADADDSIIITDDKHIKADLIKTTIFTIVVTVSIIALKYFHPLT